ncbi:hypothetical protein HDU80_002060, partial [Chytriomyces hyalinus]
MLTACGICAAPELCVCNLLATIQNQPQEQYGVDGNPEQGQFDPHQGLLFQQGQLIQQQYEEILQQRQLILEQRLDLQYCRRKDHFIRQLHAEAISLRKKVLQQQDQIQEQHRRNLFLQDEVRRLTIPRAAGWTCPFCGTRVQGVKTVGSISKMVESACGENWANGMNENLHDWRRNIFECPGRGSKTLSVHCKDCASCRERIFREGEDALRVHRVELPEVTMDMKAMKLEETVDLKKKSLNLSPDAAVEHVY